MVDEMKRENTALKRSHAELHAGLRIAAKEIKRLSFGKKNSRVLEKLRQIYRESKK
jgi:hypothetical protein